MASNNEAYFSHSIQGVPNLAGEVDVYAMNKSPKFPLGYKIERVDGHVYRYSHFGADTNRGVLCAQDFSEVSRSDSDNNIVASASALVTSDGTLGSKYIEITGGQTVQKDQFAGGNFITSDDTGEGFTYPIKGNTASGYNGALTFRLELAYPLIAAVDNTTDNIIIANRFHNLEVASAATDNFLAGVTTNTMDVSEASYGWVQTKGVVGILTETNFAVAAGDVVVLSSYVNGSVGSLNDLTGEARDEQIIGTCIDPGDTTGHGAYYINLE